MGQSGTPLLPGRPCFCYIATIRASAGIDGRVDAGDCALHELIGRIAWEPRKRGRAGARSAARNAACGPRYGTAKGSHAFCRSVRRANPPLLACRPVLDSYSAGARACSRCARSAAADRPTGEARDRRRRVVHRASMSSSLPPLRTPSRMARTSGGRSSLPSSSAASVFGSTRPGSFPSLSVRSNR